MFKIAINPTQMQSHPQLNVINLSLADARELDFLNFKNKHLDRCQQTGLYERNAEAPR